MTTDTKIAEVMGQLRAALDARPTPGLWQQPYKLTGRFGIYSGDGKPIAKVEREADAKLIASANPEAIRTILDALEAAQAALRWYRDEAAALAKHMSDGAHTQAVLASVTVLSLDAGRRADAAIAETQPSSNAIRPDEKES